MNTFDGYIRRNGTNSKVLLDGGNAKALSEFIGTISYANNKITYTKADGTSYDLVDLSNYIYNLRVATSDSLGGIRIGFSQSGKNYPVQLDSNNKAYVYVPWEENSHYTTRLYVGDGTAENKITTNGNTRITVTDNNNVRNYITLIGSGATNISSDDNGKITINSINTTYNTGDSATLNKGTNTEGKLWSAKTLVDYISDILGVDSTAITSLNTLIGLLHDNDTATGILVELAKKLNTPSSSIGSNTQPIYWNGSSFATIGYTIEKSVPSNAIFTDTKYSFYVGENNNIKEHKNVSNPYFKLFENNTPTSIQIKAGTGISVNSDTNGNITIKNESPDLNHNTDKTGIKLGTISGTKKTDSTVIINNSSTGLTIAGGTNKFSIGDGTNYIEIPITPSFTVSNKDSTIGTSLTTIATIAGTDIKAKIGSYLPLSGGIMTGNLILKGDTSHDMTYSGNIHPFIRFDNIDSSLNVSLIFTDFDSYRYPAGIKLVGNLGDEWFEAPTIYQNGTKVAVEGHTHNRLSSQGVMNPETGRTSERGGIYSYNTNALYHTEAPAKYTSIIGFGRGTLGHGEISINWVEGSSTYTNGIWYRGLRDYLDNWYGWTHILDEHNTYISNGTITINGTSITPITSLSDYPTKSETILDAGNSITNTIYSLGAKRVFSGSNLTDAPVKGWVSGLVLGSNWNNNHYLHYLVEANNRWYATRDYQYSKMINWNTFAYLSDIPTKVSLLTNDSGYLTSHLSLPDMIKRHDTKNEFNDTAGLRVITVSNDSTLLGSIKYGSIIQWSNANYSPSIFNSRNWYNQLMGLTDDRLYFRTRTNGDNWTNFHKVAWTSDIPTKSSWNYDDRYLKLSTGGTVLGTTTFKTDSYGTQLEIYRNTNYGNPSIKFNNPNSITNRYIGFEANRNGDNAFYFTDDNATNKYYVASEDYVTSRGYLTSHYITHLYAGSGSSENAITTNGNTKLTITDDSIVRNSITIKGSGSTSVTSDANGIITIDSSDRLVLQRLTSNNTNYPLLFSAALNNNTTVDVTNAIFRNNSIYANPSTGTITANKFNGSATHAETSSQSGSVSIYTLVTSYWGKLWEIDVKNKRYDDRDVTFLLQSAFNYILGTLHVKIKQNGANGSGAYDFKCSMHLTSGNIRKGRLRLYYNNSTGNCQLWFNCVSQYGVINAKILHKTDRIGMELPSLGTLFLLNAATEQTLPGTGYVYVEPTYAVYAEWNDIQNKPSSYKVQLEQCTDDNVNYPLVWAKSPNNDNFTQSVLYKSFNDLTYNPSRKWLRSGILELYPDNTTNYTEGIRIHAADDGFTTLIFCGTDNTGISGTSANSWWFGTNNGNLYINRNNSSEATVNRLWGHSNGYTIGNTTESGYNFTVGGTSRFIGTTTTSQILPASSATYNIGSNTVEYAMIFSRHVFARHLSASVPYSDDKDLYLGYYSTTNIQFYTTDASGNNRKKVALFKQDGNAIFNNTVTASSFYSSSDIRLKNIISNIQYSSEEIASLRSVKYTWKNKNEKVHIGSIALDVERIIPEVVNIDNEGYKSLDYATLGAIGVISLAREIVELKKEIKELKSKLYG